MDRSGRHGQHRCRAFCPCYGPNLCTQVAIQWPPDMHPPWSIVEPHRCQCHYHMPLKCQTSPVVPHTRAMASVQNSDLRNQRASRICLEWACRHCSEMGPGAGLPWCRTQYLRPPWICHAWPRCRVGLDADHSSCALSLLPLPHWPTSYAIYSIHHESTRNTHRAQAWWLPRPKPCPMVYDSHHSKCASSWCASVEHASTGIKKNWPTHAPAWSPMAPPWGPHHWSTRSTHSSRTVPLPALSHFCVWRHCGKSAPIWMRVVDTQNPTHCSRCARHSHHPWRRQSHRTPCGPEASSSCCEHWPGSLHLCGLACTLSSHTKHWQPVQRRCGCGMVDCHQRHMAQHSHHRVVLGPAWCQCAHRWRAWSPHWSPRSGKPQ